MEKKKNKETQRQVSEEAAYLRRFLAVACCENEHKQQQFRQ